jgi:hypothetical protein
MLRKQTLYSLVQNEKPANRPVAAMGWRGEVKVLSQLLAAELVGRSGPAELS